MILHDRNFGIKDIQELERFLAAPPMGESALDIFGLEGFFAALLLAPTMIMPSQWIRWVWDHREGRLDPEFATFEEAQRTFNLLMGFYNRVASHLATDPEAYEPLLELAGGEEAGAWREGFLVGMRLDGDAWADLAASKPEWLAPILGLGLPADGGKPGQTDGRRWTREAGVAVAAIHDFWLSRRRQRPPGMRADPFSSGPASRPPRTTVKVGRNELCACGSGKKYKRCCGANRS